MAGGERQEIRMEGRQTKKADRRKQTEAKRQTDTHTHDHEYSQL